MPRGGKRAEKRGMVVRYGDDYDCGVWAPCDMEIGDVDEEREEYDTQLEYQAECIGGYRDCGEEEWDCGVLGCDKGDDDSQLEWE